MSSGIHTRRRGVLAALAVLLVAGFVSVSTPAFAHDELIGTDPAADSTVAETPSEIVLTFSGILLDDEGSTVVQVVDAACADVTDGEPVVDGVRVTQALTAAADGPVTVTWRVVSSDGHPISESYAFSIGDEPDATPCAQEEATNHDAGDAFDPTLLLVLGGVVLLAAVIVAIVVFTGRNRAPDED